jgi:hypothetical protein
LEFRQWRHLWISPRRDGTSSLPFRLPLANLCSGSLVISTWREIEPGDAEFERDGQGGKEVANRSYRLEAPQAQAAMANRNTKVGELCTELGASRASLYNFVTASGSCLSAGRLTFDEASIEFVRDNGVIVTKW